MLLHSCTFCKPARLANLYASYHSLEKEEEYRMSQLTNPMEIFKLLDKSNCRECREATCLAFAAAVFKGQKQLENEMGVGPRQLADTAKETVINLTSRNFYNLLKAKSF